MEKYNMGELWRIIKINDVIITYPNIEIFYGDKVNIGKKREVIIM